MDYREKQHLGNMAQISAAQQQLDLLRERLVSQYEELLPRDVEALTRVAALEKLHCAVVEFSVGDSAANELGSERIISDNVLLEEANAMGSYIFSEQDLVEKVDPFDDRDIKVELNKKGGNHRVMLDLDVPHVYIPSSTPGHGHLVIDVPVNFTDLMKLLQLLGDMKILQYGFVDATKNRGETWLRTPGTKKTHDISALAKGK